MRQYGFYQKFIKANGEQDGHCKIADYITSARNIGEAKRKFRDFLSHHNQNAYYKLTFSKFDCFETLQSLASRGVTK